MKIQTLNEIEHSLGGRPVKISSQKKVRLSFYLNVNDAELLKVYVDKHEKTISKIVREQLKLLLNN